MNERVYWDEIRNQLHREIIQPLDMYIPSNWSEIAQDAMKDALREYNPSGNMLLLLE